jgi:hypothetical protein
VTSLLLAALLVSAGHAAVTRHIIMPAAQSERSDTLEFAQLTFHSRVVIRVETRSRPAQTKWREKKGPHCVTMEDILGAAIIEPSSVDLVLRGGDRVRARFASSCPGLDYYSGFYIAPPADAKICAGRDVIRDRAGGECAISRFRKLVPDK